MPSAADGGASAPPLTTSTSVLQPDPELLAQLRSLALRTRAAAQGAQAGVHRSRRHGDSVIFAEHKVYAPGDDVRRLDWRAYAKTDRFHIKRFEDEANLTLQLWLDHSGSMGFAQGGRPSKLVYASRLAAVLAHLALTQGDAAGLCTFAADVTSELPARSGMGHLAHMLARLTPLTAAGPTGVERVCQTLGSRRTRRQVIVMLTDLLDPGPGMLAAIGHLAARRHDVAVLHVLDPTEIDFDFTLPATFQSLEDTRSVFVHPRTFRSRYQAQMQTFLKRTQTDLAAAGVAYHLARTDRDPATLLARYLNSHMR